MNDDELLAAEYVLGTLNADERSVLATVLLHDGRMRELVTAWQNKLAPLWSALPDVVPPPEVWQRILRALDAPPSEGFTVIDGGRTDAPRWVPPTVETEAVSAMRRSLGRWRGITAAATALAAGLALFVVEREISRPAVQPSYVAVVNRGGDQPALVVRVDLASGRVFVRPVAAEAPSGKSLELWYIDVSQGKAPKSMGLIDKGPVQARLPFGAKMEKAMFAVSVEPEGGSPTGGPTGPIVYTGQLIKE